MMQEAISALQGGSRFLVTCHRRPDADALGSAVAMTEVLRTLGKEVVLFVPEVVAPALQFLIADETPVRDVSAETTFDATWVMDVAAAKLLPPGLPGRDVTGTLIIVDHHFAHDAVGDIILRDPDASATGEMVVRLLDALKMPAIPPGAVVPLYAAIVSDTGGFRYRGTSPETLRIGARLVEAGADPWHVAYELFERWPPQRIELLRAVLGTLERSHGGRVATLRVTRDMLAACDATDDMVEGMVNYARRLDGVLVGALLWEWLAPSSGGGGIDTKISLRSSGDVDVSQAAVALGGGGHRGAAAVQVADRIDVAAKRLDEELVKLLP